MINQLVKQLATNPSLDARRFLVHVGLALAVLFYAPSASAEHQVTFSYCGQKFLLDGHKYPYQDDRAKRIEAWIKSSDDPRDEEKRKRCKADLMADAEAELQQKQRELQHKQKCSTSWERSEEIYDRCFVEHYEKGADTTLRLAIMGMCERIACNPSLFERFKY